MPLLIALLASICLSLTAFGDDRLSLWLDEESGTIGKYIAGVHFVYSHERDAIYADDWFAKWARRAGVAVARFPGGTVVQYWDWRNPTGYLAGDSWDRPNAKRAPPSNWMSIDEYLHFVDVSGVTPLIGINLMSGVRNNRVDESVARAVEQVRYVLSEGYSGAFYYLGNEDMAQMGGLEEAARMFVRHAREIKRVDPGAKLFWNDEYVNKVRLRKFLAIAGEYADGVEFHGKWPYRGRELDRKISFAEWQRQYPFSILKSERFSERALALRRHADELGYPNLMFANNEYGLAPFEPGRFIGFDRYKYGLVAIEFLQDLIIGRFDMAAFWTTVPTNRSRDGDKAQRHLVSTESGNRLNPVHFGIEMLSSAQGKRLIHIAGGGPGGYGFAALSDEQLEIFLLNKSSEHHSIEVRIEGEKGISAAGSMTSLVDTPDHWGTLERRPVTLESRSIEANLPPQSYSKIVLPLVPPTR